MAESLSLHSSAHFLIAICPWLDQSFLLTFWLSLTNSDAHLTIFTVSQLLQLLLYPIFSIFPICQIIIKMVRLQESFRKNQGESSSMSTILFIMITGALAISVGMKTVTVMNEEEKEINNKSLFCMKELQQNKCNPFAPESEECQHIINCIKAGDEPALDQIYRIFNVVFNQLQKLSFVPLAILGLILVYQIKKKV